MMRAVLFLLAGAVAFGQFGQPSRGIAPRTAVLPSTAFAHIDSTGMDSTMLPGNYRCSYDAFGFGWIADNGDVHILARRGREHVDDVGFVSQWSSTDDGTTWTRATLYDSASFDDRNIAGGHDDATNRVVAFWEAYPALTTSYCVSTNGGATWGNVQRLKRWSDTARVVPYGPMFRLGSNLYQTFYMISWGWYKAWIYRSTDNGDTWAVRGRIDSLNAAFSETAAWGLSNGAMLAAVRAAEYTTNKRQVFYKSLDSGLTWSRVGLFPHEPSNDDSAAVSPWLYEYAGRVYFSYQWRATKAGYRHTLKLSSAALASALDTAAWTAPVVMYTRPWAFVYNSDSGYPSIDFDRYGKPRWFWYSGSYDGNAINSPNLMVSKP